MLPEVVIFDCDVFGSGSKLWAFSYSNAAAVVLKYFAMELWLWVVEWENVANFDNEIHKRYDLPHRLRQCYVLSFSRAECNLGLQFAAPGQRTTCIHDYIARSRLNAFRIHNVS